MQPNPGFNRFNNKTIEYKLNKHPTTIEKYNGSLKELAEDIGNLRYDALEELFIYLFEKFERDAKKDYEQKRMRAAFLLFGVTDDIKKLRYRFKELWNFCKPHMKEK